VCVCVCVCVVCVFVCVCVFGCVCVCVCAEVLPRLVQTLFTHFLPLSFQSCLSVISSPSISMWIHSKFYYVLVSEGHAVVQLRHCAASREAAGSIPDVVTMAVGLTQPLTEMSTRDISLGVKAAGA
jgi:hypothetical protein